MKRNLSAYYEQYKRTTATTLSDVYGRYSTKKQDAYDWCMKKMDELEGYGMKVLSATTYHFTVGFLYTDKETGKLMFDVETSCNSYEWEVVE